MNIYREISDNDSQKRIFVLATIIKTSGSAPRKVGAKMIIYPDGTISGTIGGGKFEKIVIEDSLTLIQSESNHLFKNYNLSKSGKDPIGMTCGGTVDVFLELILPKDQLFIFGGGHIGFELAQIAIKAEFDITIIDDREEILDRYDNPFHTILTDSDYSDNFPDINPKSYLVMVNKSHDCDKKIIKRLVNKDFKYLGMVASKAKVAEFKNYLNEIDPHNTIIGKLHSPIGLDINAEGPFEIAVSILAELISIRNESNE